MLAFIIYNLLITEVTSNTGFTHGKMVDFITEKKYRKGVSILNINITCHLPIVRYKSVTMKWSI